MSTRGCVAIGTAEGWSGGRFVQKCGLALPMEVWDIVSASGGVERFQQLVREHPAGFFSFPNECFCHMTDERARALLFSDGVNRSEMRLDRACAESMGVEVACVLEVAKRTLHLFVLGDEECDELVCIASIPIDGPPPNWRRVDAILG